MKTHMQYNNQINDEYSLFETKEFPIFIYFVLKLIGFKFKNNFILHLSPVERNRITLRSYILFSLSMLIEKKKRLVFFVCLLLPPKHAPC